MQKEQENKEIVQRQWIKSLIENFCKNEVFDQEAETLLVQLADNFIVEVINNAASMAKLRGGTTIEQQDVQQTLEKD